MARLEDLYLYGAGQSAASIIRIIETIEKFIRDVDDVESPICITGAVPPWVSHWEPAGWEILNYLHMSTHPKAAARIVLNLRTQKKKAIILTHSPWIISDIPRKNVLVFETRALLEPADFNTFGASVNLITMRLLNQTMTMGDYAMHCLEDIQERARKGEDPSKLIAYCGHAFGESVERTILINNLMDLEERKKNGGSNT